jgi:hypothetical protein
MMNIRVLQNEKELYQDYTTLFQERFQLTMSIHGFPDETNNEIQKGIKEMFNGEMARLAHNELRARGVPEELLDEINLRSSLEDLPIPETDRGILEARLRQLAINSMSQKEPDNPWLFPLGGGSVWLPAGGVPMPGTYNNVPSPARNTINYAVNGTCYCMATGPIPGYPITSDMETIPSPTPPRVDITLIFYLNSYIDLSYGTRLSCFSGDVLVARVESGAPYGVKADEMEVGLTTRVEWAKEIQAWSICRGAIASVKQERRNSTPAYMKLKNECRGADTILFNKPGWFGKWWTVSHLDPSQFWKLFGGMRLTFDWRFD